MASKKSSEKTGYIVDVKILDVEKRYKTGPKHYVYVMQVTWANPTNLFIIYRRYAEFFDLQCKLLDLFVDESSENVQPRQIPFLPGKILLGRSQVRQIALERKEGLNEYCKPLITLPEHISRSGPILEFFHPLPTDVQKSIEITVQDKTPIDKSSVVISEPAKLATYRCLADFTATEKLEMSLKRNNVVQVLQKHPNGWWFVQFGDQTGFVPGAYLEPSELKRGAREGKTVEKSLKEMFVVNTTFEGKGSDELSLEQGSFVTVLEKSLTGWWRIKFDNITGQFPAVYLSSCDGRHTPENGLDDVPSSIPKKKGLKNPNESDEDDEDDYHTDPSKASELELYYAHTDFKDTVGDCLSFKRGEIIEIHDKNTSGWWFGKRMKGSPILSWVPASYLQKEPIMDTDSKTNKTQSSNSKLPFKLFDKLSKSSTNKEKEKEKISTTPIHKNDESPSTTNNVDHSQILKKPPAVEKITADKNSPIPRTSSPFRPVTNKQQTTTTTAHKNSQLTTPIPLRSVNDKQETTATTATPKKPFSTTSTAFRPLNNKQETSTTTPKKPSSTASTPIRPVNNKQAQPSKLVKNLVGKFNHD